LFETVNDYRGLAALFLFGHNLVAAMKWQRMSG